jgi:hypothetical protein
MPESEQNRLLVAGVTPRTSRPEDLWLLAQDDANSRARRPEPAAPSDYRMVSIQDFLQVRAACQINPNPQQPK